MRKSSLALLLVCSAAIAQTFDVVAIHERAPNSPPFMVPQGWTPISEGAYSDPATSLTSLICFAYNCKIPHLYLEGLPKWATNTGYSVDAKAGPGFIPASPADNTEQVRLMMRQMLADRFGLKIHSESRPATVLHLEVGKRGFQVPLVPELLPSEREGNVNMAFGDKGGRMIANKASLAGLATGLSILLPQPVLDKTGLKGYFDINLKWTAPDQSTASSSLGPDGVALLITTLEDQGLALKKASGTMQVWVVDSVQKPAEN